MPVKRNARGDEVYAKNPRPKYATDFLPDPWLASYEAEPPGYIRAVRGDLSNCYIKEQVSKPVWGMRPGKYGPERVVTGHKQVYVWTKMSDT